jgi:hypothetical protein
VLTPSEQFLSYIMGRTRYTSISTKVPALLPDQQAGFPYQMMFVSFNSNTVGVTCGAGSANPSGTPEFF